MEKKTRAANGNPQPRRYSSAAKSPTITHRVRGGLYEQLKERAEVGEVSLSEEIERRLIKSFEDESLMAALPRLIAEGIAADREAQRRALIDRATPFVTGPQQGLAMSNYDYAAMATNLLLSSKPDPH